MNEQGPRRTLAWSYDNQLEVMEQYRANASRCVALTSNTVPRELIAAAGLVPVMLGHLPDETAAGAGWLEPVFEPRIRRIFSFAFNGGLSGFDGFLIPRTSEQEYKLYLYLSEVKRQGKACDFPTPCLFNLLHTRSETSRAYGLARTRELWDDLQRLSGNTAAPEALDNAIAQSNRRRDAMRGLLALREGPAPRLSGTEAMALLGASRFVEVERYTELALQACDELETAEPLCGIPVLIQGAPLSYDTLHRELERSGAVVIGEDDWWGERAVGLDIGTNGDPIECIFEKYYLDEPSPRVFPPEVADAWFIDALARGIRAVVFYVPPDDDVLGWDLPRHLIMANDAGMATLVLREEANLPELSTAASERIRHFIESLQPAPPSGARR